GRPEAGSTRPRSSRWRAQWSMPIRPPSSVMFPDRPRPHAIVTARFQFRNGLGKLLTAPTAPNASGHVQDGGFSRSAAANEMQSAAFLSGDLEQRGGKAR